MNDTNSRHTIYTRRGDDGTTSLSDGKRIAKHSQPIELNGEIDELVALLGMARSLMPCGDRRAEMIHDVQRALMQIMSSVSREKVENSQLAELVGRMERAIDSADRGARFAFAVPGDTLLSATLHFARAKSRTVERRMCDYGTTAPVDSATKAFLNRLSDCLFAMAEKP